MGRSVDEFYDHIKTASDAGRRLPNWCVVHFAYFLYLDWTDFACEKKAWRTVSGGKSQGVLAS